MKRFLLTLALAMVLGLSATAYALPTLQLDVSNSTYDSASATVFASGDTFTLSALLMADASFNTNMTYYISAAVIPSLKAVAGGDYGSIMFGNNEIAVTGDMTFGTPGDEAKKALATHGIFTDYYYEQSFTFNTSNKAAAYNVENTPGALTASASGPLYYSSFNINVSNLKEGYGIHFDMYTKDANGQIIAFAPFSHDAQSLLTRNTVVPPPAPTPTPTPVVTPTPTPDTTPTVGDNNTTPPTDPGTGTTPTDPPTPPASVDPTDPGTTTPPISGDPGTGNNTNATPEPATMVLLGIGLMGVAVLGRKARK